MAKSKVITFKLPTEEHFLIRNYTEYEKISLSEFLTKIVNFYLLVEFNLNIHNKRLIIQLIESLKIKKIMRDYNLHVVSVRVKVDDLKYWDVYCDHHFIPRTSLIRQAISNFFYPEGRDLTIYHQTKLKRVIYNIILGTGSIDYNHLRLIFKDIDSSLLIKILDDWEVNGFIGQKGTGRDTYVPTTEIQKSMGTLFLADLLSRIF